MEGWRRVRGVERDGFTLIELMIAVAIIGVLASVALPTYNRFVLQSKGAETYLGVGNMYRAVNAYWAMPRGNQGIGATSLQRCVMSGDPGTPIEDGFYPPLYPNPEKRAMLSNNEATKALGFESGGAFYCSYAVMQEASCDDVDGNGVADCNCQDGLVYHLVAICDLDGDGLYGGIDAQVGARNGELYRQQGYNDLPWPPVTVPGLD